MRLQSWIAGFALFASLLPHQASATIVAGAPTGPVTALFRIDTIGGTGTAHIGDAPLAPVSGLAAIDGGLLVGTMGRGGNGDIVILSQTGAFLGSRPNGVGANTIPGVARAPASAAAHGFIPGHLYATADLGAASLSDSLIDLGLGVAAGPDLSLGSLRTSSGLATRGIEGLAFHPFTGLLYGSGGGLNPSLYRLSATGVTTRIGPILVDPLFCPPGDNFCIPSSGRSPGSVPSIEFDGEGSLFGGVGGGNQLGTISGNLLRIPHGAPEFSFVVERVTTSSLSALTFIPEPSTGLLLAGGLTAMAVRRRSRPIGKRLLR